MIAALFRCMSGLIACLRCLRHSRGYALGVILLVTVGVAAGVVTFTVYKGALLDPWPYAGGDRLVTFRGDYPTINRTRYPLWSASDYEALRALDTTFDHVIAGRGRDANLAAAGGAELARGVETTPNAFAMLGVRPLHGRWLTAADAAAGAPPVVLIGHALWQRRFGGALGAVGRSLPIDGVQHEIVGVMPPRFLWWGSELWLPLALDDAGSARDDRRYVVQARLRAGVGLRQANAAVGHWAQAVERVHAREYPEYTNWSVRVGPLLDGVVRDVREVLAVLGVAVVALALVAGFNVANLLLARAAARRREFAVRAALGATTAHVARALVGENLLLASVGAALGVGFGWLLIDPIAGLIPFGYLPAEANLVLDPIAAGAAVLFALAVAAFAAAPATAFLWRLRPADAMHEARATGTRAAFRARAAFVAAQLVFAAVIVSGALAVGAAFQERLATDPGFAREHAVMLRIALPRDHYPDGPALRGYALEMARRLSAEPGVDAAGIGLSAPLEGGPLHPLSVRGRDAADGVESRYEIVGGDWFTALGVPLQAGRYFDERERLDSRQVAVVNASFARTILGGADPLGMQIQAGPGGGDRAWSTIVGVVGDVRVGGVDGEIRPLVYRPLAQSVAQLRYPVVLARAAAPPAQLVASVRRVVAAYDHTAAVHDVATFDEVVRDSMGGQRLAAWVLAGFAVAVSLLTAFGVYGIVAYVARLSRAEYGLRMALGATRADVARIVGRRGLGLAAVGLGIGAVLAATGLRILGALFAYPFPPSSTVILVASALLLGVVALASGGPALRAARTNPADVLRGE